MLKTKIIERCISGVKNFGDCVLKLEREQNPGNIKCQGTKNPILERMSRWVL